MTVRALVTGASRRVGRAVALELAQRGIDLVIAGRSRSAALLETEALVRARPGVGRVESIAFDQADTDAVEEFVAERSEQPWDLLVLNASSYDRTGSAMGDDAASVPIESGDAAGRSAAATALRAARFATDAERHFRVNAASSLALAVGLAPALARSQLPGGGAIVAMGDMHVLGRPVRGFAPYLMSKAALSQMVRSLAVELAPRVRVNALHPGVVAWPEGTPPETRAAYESRIPLERPGTPEDAARAVAWLALEAQYITGVELRIDGGRWLR